MEKIKTKNLILASFITLAMIFVAMFGFAACGPKGEDEQQLTNADVAGVWYSTQVVVAGKTGEDASSNGTYTYTRYQELKAIDDGDERDLTLEEQLEYHMFGYAILQNYKLELGEGTAKGKVYNKGVAEDENNYAEVATWEIVNNKVELTVDDEDITSITWARSNDLAIVTISFADESTCTYTLAKVAAE
ncbi:MAG: hypothetical protein IJ837_02585 [Clostridia bacterium]|nr:hypothetical protein [Clostridia bacterium]